jgi:hypothetical protein
MAVVKSAEETAHVFAYSSTNEYEGTGCQIWSRMKFGRSQYQGGKLYTSLNLNPKVRCLVSRNYLFRQMPQRTARRICFNFIKKKRPRKIYSIYIIRTGEYLIHNLHSRGRT